MSEMTLLTSATSILIGSFMMLAHPLFLVLLLISLTMAISMGMLLLFNCSWLMMLMFLIFLGGLLVIFAYLSVLIPNELEKKQTFWMLLFLAPLISNQFSLSVWQTNLSKILNQTNFLYEMSFVLFLLMYLLMALITSMILSQNLKGPLHQESY